MLLAERLNHPRSDQACSSDNEDLAHTFSMTVSP